MTNYTEYFNKCCDKTYLAETDEFRFTGILLNYNGGNVILYNEEKETICHIPYRDLRTLRPIKKELEENN